MVVKICKMVFLEIKKAYHMGWDKRLVNKSQIKKGKEELWEAISEEYNDFEN